MNKVLTAFLLLLGCHLITPAALWAERVSIQSGRMSVDLKEASLISIARDIERQSGISFKGDESLLEERVSVAFEDLPLEQGIKRILATLNYSLLYDSRGEISEVAIMPEGSAPPGSQPQLRRGPVRPGTPLPAQRRPVVRRPGATSPLVSGESRTPVPTRSRTATPRSSPQRPAQTAPSASQTPSESDLPEPFRSIDTAPPPGGTVEPDGPLHPAFKVLESAEPAAVTVKSPGEIPKQADAQKDEKSGEEDASKGEPASSPQKD